MKNRLHFKSLTAEEKLRIKNVYLDKSLDFEERLNILSEYIGKNRRTVQNWVSKLGLTEKSIEESPEFNKAKERQFNQKKKRFIITWAQNNTPVHERFLKNIEEYGKHIEADIHVIAGRYKNPTSIFTNVNHDRWHKPVIKYLDAARHDIHKYLSIMSDVKIQPTAVDPMTGMQGMSGINSCVFGSPKIQMEMIPVLEGCKPKMMLTTGACTVKNYTDSKAGKKGEFHHTLGFVVAEIKDDDTFFIRQVSAKEDGSFIDLYNSVEFEGEEVAISFENSMYRFDWNSENFGAKPNHWIGKSKVTRIKKIEACILGDIHYGHEDPEIMEKTFSMLDILKPKHVILHDVFDGASISHHDMKDPFAQYAKEVHGKNSLRDELDHMLDGLDRFKKFKNVVIVRSNHDDFLDRWLKNEDWKKQPTPKNAPEYMEFSAMLLKQYAKATPEEGVKGVIPELINQRYPDFITLRLNDNYMVKGWQLANHGHVGSNGSRGSLGQFRSLNSKIIVGHYHAPGRKDGAMAVGTCTKLRVGYNVGPSSWLNSHVIIHKNGKAQHINFIDGEYTTLT